jgi:hypothetical protein
VPHPYVLHDSGFACTHLRGLDGRLELALPFVVGEEEIPAVVVVGEFARDWRDVGVVVGEVDVEGWA